MSTHRFIPPCSTISLAFTALILTVSAAHVLGEGQHPSPACYRTLRKKTIKSAGVKLSKIIPSATICAM